MRKLIGSTPLREGEEMRVTLESYRGRTYVHARRYYRDAGEWKPGKGLGIPVCLAPRLRAHLEAAERELLLSDMLTAGDYTVHDLEPPASLTDEPALGSHEPLANIG